MQLLINPLPGKSPDGLISQAPINPKILEAIDNFNRPSLEWLWVWSYCPTHLLYRDKVTKAQRSD